MRVRAPSVLANIGNNLAQNRMRAIQSISIPGQFGICASPRSVSPFSVENAFCSSSSSRHLSSSALLRCGGETHFSCLTCRHMRLHAFQHHHLLLTLRPSHRTVAPLSDTCSLLVTTRLHRKKMKVKTRKGDARRTKHRFP